MRLYNFLDELNSIVTVKDKDFPYGYRVPVLVFSDDEIYKEENNTHGMFSHAIKHFGEFFENQKGLIFNVFEKVISNSNKKTYLVMFDSSGIIKKIIKENPKVSDLKIATLLTTLDLIQDKVILNNKITDEEKLIYNELKDPISNAYLKIAEHFTAKAYKITPEMQNLYDRYEKTKDDNLKSQIEKHKVNIDKNQIVKFNIISRGVHRQLVYDFKKSTLIALNKNGENIMTMHQLIKHVKDESLRNNKYYYSNSISQKEAKDAILDLYGETIPKSIYMYFPSVKL